MGQRFKEQLIAKASEGVRCLRHLRCLRQSGRAARVQAVPANIHTAALLRRSAGPGTCFDPRRYALDHRKLLVVDGHIGFIGGYNIGSLYATEWRDTHLRIVGPAATDLAQSFVDFWNRAARAQDRIRRRYPRRFDPTIQLRSNDALRLTFPIRDMYIDAIDRAEHHICLTNAYFIPDHVLLEALKAAAERGVDVQVLRAVDLESHRRGLGFARLFHRLPAMRASASSATSKAMIHAKTCTIDGQWSTIGTANLDRLSSVGNYEINVEIYSEALARQMEELFACDKTNAPELTLEGWIHRPWYQEVSERILAPLRLML